MVAGTVFVLIPWDWSPARLPPRTAGPWNVACGGAPLVVSRLRRDPSTGGDANVGAGERLVVVVAVDDAMTMTVAAGPLQDQARRTCPRGPIIYDLVSARIGVV